jgi:hypothetical protein
VKLLCKLCQHVQDAEHLAVRCGGCGARQSMTFAPGAPTLKPGEPIVGPSRAPITGGLRGPLDEPLDVTRQRHAAMMAMVRAGVNMEVARNRAMNEVPVQCGRCGGELAGCKVCGGVATAPTAALVEERTRRGGTRRRGRKAAAP